MNALIPFDFEGRAVRVVEDEAGLPWFVARDVCECLGLSNTTRALERLDDDEQALISVQGISRGNDQVNVVNEPGLYSLTLTSRKPEAKRFKRWVTHEVLPSLRKTGSYSIQPEPAAPSPLLSGPEHRADQLVSAGRIFSSALRTAQALRMSPARAMRAAFDCAQRHTGIDWAEELDAGDVVAVPQAPVANKGVAGFLAAWRKGDLGVPFAPCLSTDAHELYRRWCEREGVAPLHLPRFVSALGRSNEVHVVRKRWVNAAGVHGPHGFLMPPAEPRPKHLSEHEWLGGYVESFRRALNS